MSCFRHFLPRLLTCDDEGSIDLGKGTCYDALSVTRCHTHADNVARVLITPNATSCVFRNWGQQSPAFATVNSQNSLLVATQQLEILWRYCINDTGTTCPRHSFPSQSESESESEWRRNVINDLLSLLQLVNLCLDSKLLKNRIDVDVIHKRHWGMKQSLCDIEDLFYLYYRFVTRSEGCVIWEVVHWEIGFMGLTSPQDHRNFDISRCVHKSLREVLSVRRSVHSSVGPSKLLGYNSENRGISIVQDHERTCFSVYRKVRMWFCLSVWLFVRLSTLKGA